MKRAKDTSELLVRAKGAKDRSERLTGSVKGQRKSASDSIESKKMSAKVASDRSKCAVKRVQRSE